MKKILVFILGLVIFTQAANAQQFVSGYIRRDGVYVSPYIRSDSGEYPYGR
jgi:hypothetical protein